MTRDPDNTNDLVLALPLAKLLLRALPACLPVLIVLG